MGSKEHSGRLRRRMVSDRSRRFFGDIAKEAAAGLPDFRRRIDRQVQTQQQQQVQQQQSKIEPDDKTS